MKTLDEPGLMAALGAWLDRSAIRGILERRAKMQEVVTKLQSGKGQ